MQHSEGLLTAARNQSIYYQYWQTRQAPRAVIVIAHGAAEHGGRYSHFAAHFVALGFAVAALDHPGHGKSEGTPGHMQRLDDFVTALDLFHHQVASDFPAVPQILLGHSMGGLISCLYLLDHSETFAGCILSGPALMSDIQPGFFQFALIRLLSTIAPGAGVLQLDANGVSRDPAEVARYIADPLVYTGKLSARCVSELFKGMERVQQQASAITTPLLILHGADDAMASPEGSRFLDSHAGSTHKTLHIYPGLYHEIFNEPEKEQVFADILNWCNELGIPEQPAA